MVLGLQYERQLVNVNMHADSPFVQRIFWGKMMGMTRPKVAAKLKKYATKNGSESIDDFPRLYTVLVLNTVLRQKGNKILLQFVYAYDLVVFGYFSWGKLVHLVENMSKHVARKSRYFEGCTIGLLTWVHERVNSPGYTTRVLLFPRFFRWIRNEILKDEKKARIMFEGIRLEDVTHLLIMCEEESKFFENNSLDFSDPVS